LGHQMPLGDLQLLLLRISAQLNDLHAVAQRRRNGVHPIGGGDEENVGKVEGSVEVVVAKAVVLLGVQHFQKGGGRVAAEILAELVYLVQNEDRIVALCSPQAQNDLPRQRADIG